MTGNEMWNDTDPERSAGTSRRRPLANARSLICFFASLPNLLISHQFFDIFFGKGSENHDGCGKQFAEAAEKVPDDG
jgi:hypothetical protein